MKRRAGRVDPGALRGRFHGSRLFCNFLFARRVSLCARPDVIAHSAHCTVAMPANYWRAPNEADWYDGGSDDDGDRGTRVILIHGQGPTRKGRLRARARAHTDGRRAAELAFGSGAEGWPTRGGYFLCRPTPSHPAHHSVSTGWRANPRGGGKYVIANAHAPEKRRDGDGRGDRGNGHLRPGYIGLTRGPTAFLATRLSRGRTKCRLRVPVTV